MVFRRLPDLECYDRDSGWHQMMEFCGEKASGLPLAEPIGRIRGSPQICSVGHLA